MNERLRMSITMDAVRDELSLWFATCPYNGLEEYFQDEQFEEFVLDIAEQKRDDWGDQKMEEDRDARS